MQAVLYEKYKTAIFFGGGYKGFTVSVIHSYIVYKKTLENISIIAYYLHKAIKNSIHTVYETFSGNDIIDG